MAVRTLEIRSRDAYDAGPGTPAYERIDGVAHYAVDPADPANGEIVDLDFAARGADGLVHFDGDFCILRPVDGGAARLLADVPNRGGRPIMHMVNRAPRPTAPTTAIDPGDGFLFRRRWTLAWAGWQWDVADHEAFLGFRAPTAFRDGQPIPGTARIEIAGATRRTHVGLRDETLGPSIQQPLVAADIDEPGARLFSQPYPDGPRTEIPREQWRFARVDDSGNVVADARYCWLEGGFEPGCIYTVLYTAGISPVVGAGLLATRDFSSFLRYGSAEEGNPCAGSIRHAYSIGVSQSGRFQRTLLYHGLNLDEAGRQVYDGMHIHIAGARRGEFNWRHALPSIEGAYGAGHLPPHLDNAGDGAEGLLARQRALGGLPKRIYTNTSGEYWRGDGAFVHMTRDGEDAPLDAGSRVYLFAATAHSPGLLPFARKNVLNGDIGRNFFTVLDYRPLTRSALINLDRWVAEGVEPPDSVYPTRAAGTLVLREDVIAQLNGIGGIATPGPQGLRRLRELDYGPDAANGVMTYPPVEGREYESRVSSVDGDGNDIAGLRLPDVAHPVATYAGWNPRDPQVGGNGQLLRLAGSTVPFARTASERQPGDTRPALDERYVSRDAYRALCEATARALVSARHILAEDFEIVVEAALERYDAVLGAP